MKIFKIIILLAVTCLGSLQAQNLTNEELLKRISKGFSQVAKIATPAVVYIESQVVKEDKSSSSRQQKKGPSENPFDYFHEEFFNRFFGLDGEDKKKTPEVVRGSGFFVAGNGYIMTNNHVVENATTITVTLYGGKKVSATVVGTDPQTDLAVIQVDEKNIPYLKFGDSDALEVGDWAIAIGNPFGLEATVTVGVVSAKGRNQLHITDFEDFIQTDAAINPGNSGGPLLNVEGEVVGVNTAIVSGSGGYMGIGFAIPSRMAGRIKDQLIKAGSVTRGFLGVTLQPVDAELAKYYKLEKIEGALISDVAPDSPADKAGLQQEDIVLSFNGTPVENLSSFRNAVALMDPGSKLKLKILREGKEKEVVVTISSSPAPAAASNGLNQKLGMQVQEITPEKAKELKMEGEKGILILSVKENSVAYKAGLRSGDLIVQVNRKKVATMAEFNAATQEGIKDKSLLLMVRHGETVRFVALQLEG